MEVRNVLLRLRVRQSPPKTAAIFVEREIMALNEEWTWDDGDKDDLKPNKKFANYRIKRRDSKNITIQRQLKGGSWIVESYCGNNLNSLLRALLELSMKDYAPTDEKLSDAIEKARLELISTRAELAELIKNYRVIEL
jgi:hypothetical protein